MASKYFEIERTLIGAVKAVDSVTPASFPNATLKEYPDGLWLNVHNRRGKSTPVTLGDSGEDNHPGFLQIDVNYPQNKGTKQILEKVDEFTEFFTAGKGLLYTVQMVHVVSSTVSPGRDVGGYYRVSITIVYYARTFRN